jgi:hypothetical protein
VFLLLDRWDDSPGRVTSALLGILGTARCQRLPGVHMGTAGTLDGCRLARLLENEGG